MQKVISAVTILFFIFILWIIYLANSGSESIFFDLVHALPFGDKIGHLGLFGSLTLGSNLLTKGKLLSLGSVRMYYGTLFVSLFVTIEEGTQYFIPSRTFDLIDLSADAVGIGVATGVTFLLVRKKSRDA